MENLGGDGWQNTSTTHPEKPQQVCPGGNFRSFIFRSLVHLAMKGKQDGDLFSGILGV